MRHLGEVHTPELQSFTLEESPLKHIKDLKDFTYLECLKFSEKMEKCQRDSQTYLNP